MAISGTTALIIAAVVAAAAAGAGMYMQSEAQAAQQRSAAKLARLQEEAELANAEAARKNSKLKSDRFLRSQMSKAGKAGVVAGEGSLFVNQMEAASLAQYEEDLAARGHEIDSRRYGYEAKLFNHGARATMARAPYSALVSGAAAGFGTYSAGGGSYGFGSGSTVATQRSASGTGGGVM
jgi:hypothetical protein